MHLREIISSTEFLILNLLEKVGSTKIKIAHRVISENHHPFIIAEMSANHNGSIERAIKLIKLAKTVELMQ